MEQQQGLFWNGWRPKTLLVFGASIGARKRSGLRRFPPTHTSSLKRGETGSASSAKHRSNYDAPIRKLKGLWRDCLNAAGYYGVTCSNIDVLGLHHVFGGNANTLGENAAMILAISHLAQPLQGH